MNSYGSDLSLQGVRVEKFIFTINDSVAFDDMDEIKISVVPTPKISASDSSKGRLELEVSLFDENFLEKQFPFYLKMEIVGLFEDEDYSDNPESSVFDKYLANAISMLYAYARSHIASVTGMFGIDVVNIPTINVIKLLQELSESRE